MPQRWTVDVTIPAGATGLSGVNDFGGGAKDIGIIVPAAWVAASISFQVSATGAVGTFMNLYNEAGTEKSAAIVAGTTQSLNTIAPFISPFRYIIVRSGTIAGGAVDQTATRTLKFTFER